MYFRVKNSSKTITITFPYTLQIKKIKRKVFNKVKLDQSILYFLNLHRSKT